MTCNCLATIGAIVFFGTQLRLCTFFTLQKTARFRKVKKICMPAQFATGVATSDGYAKCATRFLAKE